MVYEWLVFLFDVKVWVIILAVMEIKDNDTQIWDKKIRASQQITHQKWHIFIISFPEFSPQCRVM